MVRADPDYVRLASHYGFAPDFCHANDPQSGHRGEPVWLRQRDLAVPLLTRPRSQHTAGSAGANAAAVTWCTEVNAVVHSEIHAIPDERLIMNANCCSHCRRYDCRSGAPSVLRKIRRLACVRYGSARYSVPTRLIRTSVAVRRGPPGSVPGQASTGMIVAEHELVAPGSASIMDGITTVLGRAPNRRPGPRPARKSSSAASGGRRSVPGQGGRDRQHRLGSELDILLALGAAHGQDAGGGVAPGGGVPPVPRRCAFHPGRRHRDPTTRPAGNAWSLTYRSP